MAEQSPVRGMHVRLPVETIVLAKTKARIENQTLSGYVDSLIEADVARNAAALVVVLRTELSTTESQLASLEQILQEASA